eukprot:CAMPEP_0198108412 /NCGR_PEP_ID=MMETSP1442-20131203/445_1 /TAXON_ID= /ORGANISM="Craspedostauros australis, Strain CCMP3328" /LENGTH=105 /DNA_ID=CAMNT_0043763673 /DNA_START=35 /DNA_END=352 /DNA_ORIENTATION=+
MKSFQVILLAVVVACATAFAPTQSRPAFTSLAASKLPEQPAAVPEMKDNKAAMAAFATAMAPFAAQAAEGAVDEATVIGYGAGLVACVVSLAVGFSIGYGTLVKP